MTFRLVRLALATLGLAPALAAPPAPCCAFRGRVVMPAGTKADSPARVRNLPAGRVPQQGDFEVFDLELDDDGSFALADWPPGAYVVRVQQACNEAFHYRVPESSPEFHGYRWSGYYSADQDDDRKPGTLMMEEACPFHEETIRLPSKAPLLITWKSDLVRVVVSFTLKSGAAVDEEVVFAAFDGAGRVVAREISGSWEPPMNVPAPPLLERRAHVLLLLNPGRHRFTAESGHEQIVRGVLNATIPKTQEVVKVSMTLK